MYLIRHKKPKVSIDLIPWLVIVNQKIEDMYLELHGRMTDHPDDTYVCVCYDDDGTIKGMLIAYCRHDDVFLWQAHTDRSVSRVLVDEALEAVIRWAKKKGYNAITGQPNRALKIWKRRWGFKESPDNELEVIKEI